jgi:uncharacterized YigZ family protein
MKFSTLSAPAKSILKIKGSKFLGFAFPVDNEEEIDTILTSLRKQYYDATHHCYAWQLGCGQNMSFRYHDDGEPSGTAGKPIHIAIARHELTHILVVSVRYFGGTKLGTGGLARAYGQSAMETLDAAKIVDVEKGMHLRFTCSYEQHSILMHVLNEHHIISLKQDFLRDVTLDVELDEQEIPQLLEKVKNATNGNVEGRILNTPENDTDIFKNSK